ncbi:MAG: hypothetical protein VW450_04335 [Chloroflexota bacterium]
MHRPPLAALLLTALALLAACGPQATPTPTPTPTPEPLRLTLTAQTTWAEVLPLLPASETACVRAGLGLEAYAALEASLVLGSDPTVGLGGELGVGAAVELPLQCLSGATVGVLVTAGLEAEAGPLSGPTRACISGVFTGLDTEAIAAMSGEQASLDSAALGALTGLLLCLTDDEAARIGGDATGGVSLLQLRCVAGQADVRELLGAARDGAAPSPQLLAALAACEVDAGGLGISVPEGLDAEALAACARAALGDAAFEAIANGQRLPTLAEVGALGSCGLDLGSLDALSGG